MILSFSTKFPNGKLTYFVDKIWDCIDYIDRSIEESRCDYSEMFFQKTGMTFDQLDSVSPKMHTIRKDEKNRWKVGVKIHFTVFPRTKKMFQFAPVMECKSVQKIEIEYLINLDVFKAHPLLPKPISIEVDNEPLNYDQIKALAKNDGFDSVDDFFEWFSEDFTGKIIHWTNLKY